MKIRRSILISCALLPTFGFAQSAVDAFTLSKSDIKGTARYMSMGGAFGALGGDLTTLSVNPAGIGVYRSNEVGFTLDLDAQNTNSSVNGNLVSNQANTPFLLNNIGGVFTLKLNSDVVPNLNFGFTYNKTASFNRKWQGSFGNINTSMTNWIAGVSNEQGVTIDEVSGSNYFDPYYNGNAPWISILGYQGYLTNPEEYVDSQTNKTITDWTGQWGDSIHDSMGNVVNPATSGSADYSVVEKGGIDSFNIALGGNFGNIVFWGMDFDITNLNYTRQSYYGESLENAYVQGTAGIEQVPSKWNLNNNYRVSGQGFAYKLGLIFKPIQEFRIGFAFHTPTFYSLTQEYLASVAYSYNNESWVLPTQNNNLITNGGIPGANNFRFRTPWVINVSAAGVIGSKFIISGEYEWKQYSKMKFSDPYTYDYYDDWYTAPSGNSYDNDGTNSTISAYASNTNTFKVGAEYRVSPQLSVRAGYANVSSAISNEAKNGYYAISTSNLFPSYLFEDSTNYISCGLGYKIKGFYADVAYIYKHTDSTYHAFTDDPSSQLKSPSAKVGFTSNQVVLSLGYKF